MDAIFNIVIVGLLTLQVLLGIMILRCMTPTPDDPARVPGHNRRRDRRTPPGGYVNLEENDLKKAKKGVKK